MTILLLIVAVLGLLAVGIGGIWLTINAFRVSTFWGIWVFLFPASSIRFAFGNWEMARRPFCVIAIGSVMAFSGAYFLPGGSERLAAAFSDDDAATEDDDDDDESASDPSNPRKSSVPAMFAALTETELKLKLVDLQKREADLLDRKAALNPKDRQAALALTAEINKYNADLKPVLEQMRERGLDTAAR